jgi:hypothetical protein
MIIVKIDAPAVRSLNACEKQVYQKLKNGDTPLEISRALQIPCKDDYRVSLREAPLLSVEGIITSIREKGWKIPSADFKEDITDMPRGTKLPDETVKAIETMAREGKTLSEIYKSLHLPPSTVRYIVERIKKEEPAPTAIDTSSEQYTSTDSIPSGVENVKGNRLVCEVLDRELHTRAFELSEKIEALKDKLREVKALKAEYDYMAAEYDVLYTAWKGMGTE